MRAWRALQFARWPLKLTVRHPVATPREMMDSALKEKVVPLLRSQGFKGSYPHFRRMSPDRIDLLTFQFDKWGVGFVVESGSCGVDGITLHWGRHVPPSKVTAWDLHPAERLRLKPSGSPGADFWFRFDTGDYGKVAASVSECLTNAWSGRES